MTDEWAVLREEKKAFGWARNEAMRRTPRPISRLCSAAIGIWLLVMFTRGLLWGGTETLLPALAAVLFTLTIAGYMGITGVIAAVSLVRALCRWRRAKRWDVTRVLYGVALERERTEAGHPVRTIVAEVDGQTRYVRLMFARDEDSSMMPAGPVQVDLFARQMVAGPARLRPQHGGVVWAFATRKGDVLPSPQYSLELDRWFDGWPDEGPGDDSSWPGDSDGDGDGDGGE